jgi:ArsR family transcriptional regulator, virulence genes transcriptional regulator
MRQFSRLDNKPSINNKMSLYIDRNNLKLYCRIFKLLCPLVLEIASKTQELYGSSPLESSISALTTRLLRSIVSIYGNYRTMKQIKIDKTSLKKIFEMQCEICKALGHPLRLAIVDRLHSEETSATDLIADLELSKANLSKHMSLLVHGGIVESRRDGRQLFYRLTDPEIHKACAIMRSILYRRLKAGEKLASAIGVPRASH